jgi:hypothetical protein
MKPPAEIMIAPGRNSPSRPPDRHSDDIWEEAMLDDALSSSQASPRERWFEFCFRLIILALAALWLFVPPGGNGVKQPDVKAAVTQR